MTSPTTTDSARLQIHVFGAGKGESIVVGLPNGEWGVVDCYASTPNDPATNPTIEFLTRHGITELAFLCLTHPHDDHYRGMKVLWEKFPARIFWRFGTLDARSVQSLVKYIGHLEQEKTRQHDSANELVEILRRVTKTVAGRNNPNRPRVKHVMSGMHLYPLPLDPTASLQIWGIAPTGDDCERYGKNLLACFGSQGGLLQQLPHRDHNLISIGLLIQWGQTKVVLGGDMEKRAWQVAMTEFGSRLNGATAVKLSHHGSTNGYCPALWESLGSASSTIAIVTRYNRFNLPNHAALNHISQHCEKVVILGSTDEEPAPTPLSESRLALKLAIGAKPTSTRIGKCSLTFDDQGNCVDQQTKGAATDFSPRS